MLLLVGIKQVSELVQYCTGRIFLTQVDCHGAKNYLLVLKKYLLEHQDQNKNEINISCNIQLFLIIFIFKKYIFLGIGTHSFFVIPLETTQYAL